MPSLTAPFTSYRLAYWLFACCAMVAAMIVIGAITRLTESGLSIVEWRLATDMLPPLTQEKWVEEFQKYQATPEYKLKNAGMTLTEFGRIYFWEWLHRLWGRLIGLVYVVPLLWFWAKGQIHQALKMRFVVLLALGGLQGFFGWYMVKSGLINEPRVSHYRLALHLCTAFLLFGLLLAQGLALWPRMRNAVRLYATSRHEMLRVHGWMALAVLSITVVWGAFVAGLDAGLIYNEFPLMGGKLIPGEFLFLSPWWRNFLDNHATVQWLHRVLGTISFITLFALALRMIGSDNWWLKHAGFWLGTVILGQFILGIMTLLSGVNLYLATAHQANALLALGMIITVTVFISLKKS